MDKTLELLKLAKDGNRNAKEQLINGNLGLVWAVARRFIGRGHDLEDLYQIGCIGLIKCIEKFDLSYDVKFSTYAVPVISGEIKRFLRDYGIIKISRNLKETAYKVKKARDEVFNLTGLEPKLEELSKMLEIDVEEIVASLEAHVEIESIHKTIYQNDGNDIYLLDKIASAEDEEKMTLDRLVVEELLTHLDEIEQRIIRMRYFENRTQVAIAGVLGISQVQVSRIEKRSLIKMREHLNV